MHSNQYSQARFVKFFFQFSLWALWIGSGAFAEAKGVPYTQMFKKANLKRSAPLTAPFKTKTKTKSFPKNEIIQNNYLINILKNIINQNNTLINLLKNKVDREEGVGLQGGKSPVKAAKSHQAAAKPDQADTKSHQAAAKPDQFIEKFLWSGDTKKPVFAINTSFNYAMAIAEGSSVAIFQDDGEKAKKISDILEATIKGSNDQDFASRFRVPYLDQHQAEEVLRSSITLPEGDYEFSFF